jgi:cytochrome c-type biogenesis protein
VNGNDAGYEKFRAQFQETGAEERKTRILADRLRNPEPLGSFDLKSLDGKKVSSAALSGKIVVVNFWGLWCSWCLEEMPDIQKLHEKYRSDPNVAILTIDTQDEPEKVRDWMKQRNYDFPVLLDDGYVNRMGINAFPTTWFMDSRGRKAFILVAWSKWLVEEYGWRIEALKNEGS